MGTMIFLSFIGTILGFILAFSVGSKKSVKDIRYKISQEERFHNRFEKLIKCVSNDEQILYRKIFDIIYYSVPKYYIVSKSNDNYSIDGISFVQIKNIVIYMNEVVKHNSYFSDGTPYGSGIIEYECSGLTILNRKNKNSIELSPPKEQFPIYDLFVDYVLWKLSCYYDEELKAEEKKELNEHIETAKKALKILKD